MRSRFAIGIALLALSGFLRADVTGVVTPIGGAGSALSPVAAGAIYGGACSTGTCTPTALSSTDYLFNTSNDTLTLGGAGVLGNNGFSTIQPALTSTFAQALGLIISGGQQGNTAANSRAGGVIIESGLMSSPTVSGSSTGAVTIRTSQSDIGLSANVGSTGLVKIYSGGTTTAGGTTGVVEFATGNTVSGNTGNIAFTTGSDSATSGVYTTGNIAFAVGSNTSGSTGAAGNVTFALGTDADSSVTASHGSFLLTGNTVGSVSAKQDYFLNGAMAGGIVLSPSYSSCSPCNADGQIVLTNAGVNGGVAVDYQGSLEVYSGLVDNNQVATYTTSISGTNCSSITNKQGGPTAGSFNVTTGAANAICTIVLTIGQAAAIPLTVTGWVCHASESTAGTTMPQSQSALSTTACTIKGTIAASGDLVTWDARGFH